MKKYLTDEFIDNTNLDEYKLSLLKEFLENEEVLMDYPSEDIELALKAENEDLLLYEKEKAYLLDHDRLTIYIIGDEIKETVFYRDDVKIKQLKSTQQRYQELRFKDQGIFLTSQKELDHVLVDIKKQLLTYLEVAEEIAKHYFKGKKDRGKQPYIIHLTTVSEFSDSLVGKILGLLHDLREDIPITKEEFSEYFGPFSDYLWYELGFVTHERGESYDDYIGRIIQYSDFGIEVKLADLKHNMDLSRLKKITEKDHERMVKYQKAKERLESAKDH